MVPIEWSIPVDADGTRLVSPEYQLEVEGACAEVFERLGELGELVTRFKIIFQRVQGGSYAPVIGVYFANENGEKDLSYTTGIPFEASPTKSAPVKADIVAHLCAPGALITWVRERVGLDESG